jgi:hypothetical protein
MDLFSIILLLLLHLESKKYEDYLRKKTEQERVSVNIIVNRIFGEYIEWQQQFIEKLELLFYVTKSSFKS